MQVNVSSGQNSENPNDPQKNSSVWRSLGVLFAFIGSLLVGLYTVYVSWFSFWTFVIGMCCFVIWIAMVALTYEAEAPYKQRPFVLGVSFFVCCVLVFIPIYMTHNPWLVLFLFISLLLNDFL